MRLVCAILSALAAVPIGAAAAGPNVISRVAVEDVGSSVVLTIQGSRPPSFTTFATERPARFVVDVAGGELRGVAPELAVAEGPVAAVRTEQISAAGGTSARVSLVVRGELEGAEVSTRGNAVVVTVAKAGAAAPPKAVASPSAPRAERAAAAKPASKPKRSTKVAAATPPTSAARATPTPAASATPAATPAPGGDVASPARERDAIGELTAARAPAVEPRQEVREFGFRQLADASRVYVRTAGTPRFSVEERGDSLLVVRLDRARAVRQNDSRPLDTSFFPSAVARVTPRQEGGAYALEIELRAKVPYRQRIEGDAVAIEFELPGSAGTALPTAEGAAPSPAGAR